MRIPTVTALFVYVELSRVRSLIKRDVIDKAQLNSVVGGAVVILTVMLMHVISRHLAI